MTTASRIFEILDKCNRAYRVSDRGVIAYRIFSDYLVYVNWKSFLEWRDKWQGFTDDDNAEIELAEGNADVGDCAPAFDDDDETVSDYKELVWAIDSGRCVNVYAIKHFTADVVEKLHEYACVIYEYNGMGVEDEGFEEQEREFEDFFDRPGYAEAETACNDYFGDNCPTYNDLLNIKEGDAYYVKID